VDREDDIIVRLDHIIELLERLAAAQAPTPEQLALDAYDTSKKALMRAQGYKPVNATGGPQTGRGVR